MIGNQYNKAIDYQEKESKRNNGYRQGQNN